MVAIADITGKILINDYLDEEKTSIDIKSIPVGMYIITISRNNKIVHEQKLIKH